MGNYNKSSGGNRFGGNGGGSRFGGNGGGRDGGRPSFGAKKSWGNDRGEVTMHKATCSNCGKECEVPFKPVNGKPVFCRDCFNKNGPVDRDMPRPERREFNNDRPKPRFEERPRNTESFAPKAAPVAPNNDEMKGELKMVHIKLDRLINAIETLTRAQGGNLKDVVDNVVKTNSEPKKAAKKAAPKKKGK